MLHGPPQDADPPPDVRPYRHPAWYDALTARGTALEAQRLERLARAFVPCARAGARHLRWLEPACGTGRLLRALARRGHRAMGVEIDPGMAAYARGRIARLGLARRVRVVTADMRGIGPALLGVPETRPGGPRRGFDAAFCLDNSVRHLSTDEDLVAHFRGIASVLGSGGVYLVGLGLAGGADEFPSEHVVSVTTRAGVTIHRVTDFMPPGAGEDPRFETALAVVRVSGGGRDTEYGERYSLRRWTPREWRACLAGAGMTEVAVADMRGRPLEPGRTAYAVRVLSARD